MKTVGWEHIDSIVSFNREGIRTNALLKIKTNPKTGHCKLEH